jgi:hypothetical protein
LTIQAGSSTTVPAQNGMTRYGAVGFIRRQTDGPTDNPQLFGMGGHQTTNPNPSGDSGGPGNPGAIVIFENFVS